ncbi:hypothetical protein HZU83_00320 [Sphaerotilus montanus]|jgi:hypothetical protein|uniref:Nitrogen fixation protein FixH n=1 Tax=Sphaerotilus montanus TaxID=522889 RepID=A0A7Y9QUG8_9BURK|nr:hypothetical protein [Sphaerotilus montanus]NYG31141.1 hypothetical protein [Sphaerotilus montanus]NZD55127.1 hypothetical protein [Sphaerotilus montanus]
MTTSYTTPSGKDTMPWWKYKMVWLVIGGPLVVVVASFVTLGLAIRYPDPVLESVVVATPDAAHQPAMQARNHAATGGVK